MVTPFLLGHNGELENHLLRLHDSSRLCIQADAARWRGRASEVLAGYREAAVIAPGDLHIQAQLAKLNQALGDYSRRQTDSGNRIASLISQNKFAEAIPLLERAVSEEPASDENWGNLGLAYLRTDKIDRAIESLQQAITLNRSNKTSRNNLGIAYMRANNLEKAEEIFNSILSDDANYSQTLVNLALVYARTSRKSEAIAMLEKAQKIEPGNEMIPRLLKQFNK
jgi:tetratricopeptide (TPR) repeat protein